MEYCRKNIKNKSNKKSNRSSLYRGVSRNGKKWQVLLMFKKNKYYFGNYKNEEIAAKIYDYFTIKFKGNKAITNFSYNDKWI